MTESTLHSISRTSPLEEASIALSSVAREARSSGMPETACQLDILVGRLACSALDCDEQVADGLRADAAEAAELRRLLEVSPPPPGESWSWVVWVGVSVVLATVMRVAWDLLR